MFFDKIKKWDDCLCEQHVGNSTKYISTLFKANGVHILNYIDIGSNVGKVYDVLSRNILTNNVWMFEGSPILFNYSKEKYKNNPIVKLMNFAISNIEGPVIFSQESLLWHLKQDNYDGLNLGLSKIFGNNESEVNTLVQCKKISNILKDNNDMLNLCNFIKIDTENVDILILEDLLSIIDKFKTKPVIEFEINYKVLGMTTLEAQCIIDRFASCGYKAIDINSCSGDGFLIPENFKNTI